jgi:predicted AlkP superfamily phosphohydrolase/phosphomutase
MLISDHGAGPVCGPQVRLNNALADAGLLTWAPTQSRFVTDAVAGIDRFLRRTLSAEQKAKLAKWLPAGRTRIEALGLPAIDWQRTRAFAYEGFTLSPCIWINRRDRFPEGLVAPGAEYEEVCQCVIDALRKLGDPKTGAPVIPSVYRAAEIYHGAYAGAAPDLILNWWEGTTFTLAKSHPKYAGLPAVFYPSDPPRGGQDITGIHRRDGVLVAAGPQFARGAQHEAAAADLVDITPTALALLGLDVPPEMDGRAIADLITRPLATVRTAPVPAAAYDEERGEVAVYSERDEERIAKRLTDLGYM